MPSGKKPDYNLSAMDGDNICKGKVGVGWKNDDGSIAISLNAFVVLSAIDDLKLRLFPAEGYESRIRKAERASATTPPHDPDDLGDDVPF